MIKNYKKKFKYFIGNDEYEIKESITHKLLSQIDCEFLIPDQMAVEYGKQLHFVYLINFG